MGASKLSFTLITKSAIVKYESSDRILLTRFTSQFIKHRFKLHIHVAIGDPISFWRATLARATFTLVFCNVLEDSGFPRMTSRPQSLTRRPPEAQVRGAQNGAGPEVAAFCVDGLNGIRPARSIYVKSDIRRVTRRGRWTLHYPDAMSKVDSSD